MKNITLILAISLGFAACGEEPEPKQVRIIRPLCEQIQQPYRIVVQDPNDEVYDACEADENCMDVETEGDL